MKRGRVLGALVVAGALAIAGALAVVVLMSPFGGDAGEGDAATVRDSQDNAADAAGDPSGVGEGIEVHGDWVIEVRNADGSLAERREFENTLNATGAHYLTRLLDRSATMGAWAITLYGNPGPCADISPSEYCVIRETVGGALTGLTGTHFTPLSISNTQNPNELVLQGNFDAPHDGQVEWVQTWACITMPPNLDPGQCNNAGGTFTSTQLGTPVNVLTGQQVLVTVRISFS
jgi:hypothetical protein